MSSIQMHAPHLASFLRHFCIIVDVDVSLTPSYLVHLGERHAIVDNVGTAPLDKGCHDGQLR